MWHVASRRLRACAAAETDAEEPSPATIRDAVVDAEIRTRTAGVRVILIGMGVGRQFRRGEKMIRFPARIAYIAGGAFAVEEPVAQIRKIKS